LRLIACKADVGRAVVRDRAGVERISGLKLHHSWPEHDLYDVLDSYIRLIEAYPSKIGWGIWLFVRRGQIIGDGGFHGPPKDGRVEIGYSIVAEFQKRGYATEAVRALCVWAFKHEVRLIAANCEAANVASVRVLERCGFVEAGSEVRPSGETKLTWELRPGFQPSPDTGK
jgi:RimJ/RimL family protein N-acetyltransferase